MSEIKYNRSKTYLLPLISEVIGVEYGFIDHLENTYMFDEKGEFVNCLFIEHIFLVNNDQFIAYEHKLTNNQYFLKNIDVEEKVVYVFRFPEEYLPEYNLLLEGKYSEFGEDAKKIILRFWTNMYGKTTSGINAILKIKQVLYKDKKLKQEIEDRLSSDQCRVVIADNAELGEAIEVEDETFTI